MSTTRRATENQPYTSSYTPLDQWLKTHGARCMAQLQHGMMTDKQTEALKDLIRNDRDAARIAVINKLEVIERDAHALRMALIEGENLLPSGPGLGGLELQLGRYKQAHYILKTMADL